jgi:hypothetical protein
MENLRKILIKWNIAPLMIAVLFCIFSYWILSTLLALPPCDTEVGIAYVGALCTAFAGTTAILYKIYNSMQKDNHKVDEDETEE